MRRLVALSLLSGCVTVTDLSSESFDASNVFVVSARMEAGDFSYVGRPSQGTFDVDARRFGNGSNEEAAAERLAGTSWMGSVEGDALLLDVSTTQGQSGVDLAVTGPRIVDLDIATDRGTVRPSRVEGIHVITASNVRGDFVGDADIFTTGSVTLDVVPFVQTDMRIEAGGSVTLYLPFGADYDLTVRSDGDDELVVDDLGFDEVQLGQGFFNGFRVPGTVRIDILASGNVAVRELR